MSKVNFEEIFKEAVAEVPVNAKTGKKTSTFSKSSYDKFAKAMLNDSDYTAKTFKTVKGENVETEFKPTEQFRAGFVKSLLMEAGHDRAEADQLSKEIEIKNVDGFYEIQNEVNYRYMKSGRKLNMIPKEDFQGSLSIKEIEACEKERRDIASGETFTSFEGAYAKLVAKSSCPKHKKSRK